MTPLYARSGLGAQNLTLTVKTLTGKCITLDECELNDTIKKLKERICALEGIPPDQQRLTVSGVQLDQKRTIGDYNLRNGSILRLTLKLRGGGGMLVRLPFNNLENPVEKAFSPTAPEWRKISYGLNLEGKCINRRCEAVGRRVLIAKGFGEFDMHRIVHTAQCCMCNQDLQDPDNIYLTNCRFSYRGKVQNEDGSTTMKQSDEDLLAPSDKFITFENDPANKAQWLFLHIIVNRR